MKSNTCNAHFCEKRIFSHDRSVAEPQPSRIVSRKGAKTPRENELSFRTRGEIFPGSLAFARDDRPWACHLASWRLGGSNIRIPGFSTPRKFAQAAQISIY